MCVCVKRSCDAEQWFLFIWSCGVCVRVCACLCVHVGFCMQLSESVCGVWCMCVEWDGGGRGGVVLAVQLSHMKIVLMSKYCSQLARVVKPLHTHTHTLETGINNDSVQDLNQASWSRFILLT